MAITKLNTNLDIITALNDEPNDVSGLTAAQLKAKFDEGPNGIKAYLNETLIPELDAEHLPYLYGYNTTIKETLDGVVLSTVPDKSITYSKFAPGALDWGLVQSYTQAGTFTWTAPNVYDGIDYQVGVYIIGGGGSGGAAKGAHDDSHVGVCASGGASGYGNNRIITVSPGTQYAVVVGAGGIAVSQTVTCSYSNGNSGSSSSFAGYTASGGQGGVYGYKNSDSQRPATGANGGQASDATSFTAIPRTTAPCGGDNAFCYLSVGEFSNGLSQGFQGQNKFDPNMLTLAAGGGACRESAQTGASVSYGKGGNGAFTTALENITAETATGYGCGGGAAIMRYVSGTNTSYSVTSGAGAAGAVFIYIRGYSA